MLANVVAAPALGMTSAVAWVLWVSRIVDKSPAQAALADLAIILPSLLVKQMWAHLENEPLIFAGYLVGSVLGTYLAVRHARANS